MTPEARFELEMDLIGWLLMCYRNHGGIPADCLRPDAFADAGTHAVALAIAERVERGEAFTPLTIADSMPLAEILPGLTFKQFVLNCLGRALNVTHPRDYIRALTAENKRQRIADICTQAQRVALSSDTAPAEIACTLVDDLNALLQEESTVNIRDSRQVSEDVLESLKEIPTLYSTGFDLLDEAMGGGLAAGRSYGFAARKKVGKTILASTISCNLDLKGIPHLFICGEMSDKEVHQRTLARLAGVYPSVFRNPAEATPPRLMRIASASHQLTGAAKFLNAPGLTFTELKRALDTARLRYGIKGFILDYWQLVGGKDRSKSTAEHLDEVAQYLADYSRKHGIWNITMAQINQEGNTRGGEGMRLAFDQVYHLQPIRDDITHPGRWLEMLETRHTKWMNVGEKDRPRMTINDHGPFFEAA